MKYIVDSDKTVDQAVADLETAVTARGFGVLHTYDLRATLKSKGIEFPHEVRILEVCNPQQAKVVLTDDIGMNIALPCRISVWEAGAHTRIGMVDPKAMLSMLSDSPVLAGVADEVQAAMVEMIETAK